MWSSGSCSSFITSAALVPCLQADDELTSIITDASNLSQMWSARFYSAESRIGTVFADSPLGQAGATPRDALDTTRASQERDKEGTPHSAFRTRKGGRGGSRTPKACLYTLNRFRDGGHRPLACPSGNVLRARRKRGQPLSAVSIERGKFARWKRTAPFSTGS